MTPRNDTSTLAHCRVCGWSRDDGAACLRCGERLSLAGVPSHGEVLATTALGDVEFAAVSVGDGITVLAIGGAALPGQRVGLEPRDDGTLSLEVLA